MNRHTAGIIAILLFLLWIPMSGHASVMTKAGRDPAYLIVADDAAGLLDLSELQSVTEVMEEASEYCNVGFVTRGASGGGNARDDIRDWSKAVFGTRPCVVFLIDLSARQVYIWSSGISGGRMTVARTNTVTDNVYRLAQRGEYPECARQAFLQITEILRGGEVRGSMKYICNALLALIMAILAVYAVTRQSLTRRRLFLLPDAVSVPGDRPAVTVTEKWLTRRVRIGNGGGGDSSGLRGGGGGSSGPASAGSGSGHGF